MSRGGVNSHSIPFDVITEILSRLPAKSIARFRLVSKLWKSMLHRPYFTELFLTRSRARPRLLFALNEADGWSFYSTPQPHNPYSSLVVPVDFHIHMKISEDIWPKFHCLASRVIYFSNMRISGEDIYMASVICNPNTGQYTILPKLKRGNDLYHFLGFDPIDKQFKVLVMAYQDLVGDHKILTIGTGNMSWRMIQCPLTHFPVCKGICINGVLYYLAYHSGETRYVIICFDIRSENFKFIDAEDLRRCQLINYKGKLGGISMKRNFKAGGIELSIWVLEDDEWSKYVYTLPNENKDFDIYKISVVGMTATGEIVLSMYHTSKPFNIFYFNPERNTLQSVEIQGLGEELYHHRDYAFVDYVEDLDDNDAKHLKPSQAKALILLRKCRNHKNLVTSATMLHQ